MTDQKRMDKLFNEEVDPKKPILDIITLKAMFPQYADWLEKEAKRRGKNETCNCGNCLMVALRDKFDAEYPESIETFRFGWPVEDFGYPDGWAELNREKLDEDGSGWGVT